MLSSTPARVRGRTRRILLAAALPAALAAVALPAAAEANSVSFSTTSDTNEGVMQYVQTTSQGSAVTTDIINGAVHIRSSTGIQDLSLAPGCRRVDAFEVSCPGFPVDRINLFGHQGEDGFVPRTGLPTLVLGFGGDDHYFGAARPRISRVDFQGGAGTDIALYNAAQTGVSVRKDETANDGRFGHDQDNIRRDVEQLVGSTFSDSLSGSDSSVIETFTGGLGDDLLFGNGGPDRFESLAVADGADRITGGPGVDTVSYARRTQSINATLNFDGADDGEAGEGDELVGSNEQVIGSLAADTIRAPVGSTAAHVFDGQAGGDTLEGSDGPDRLIGGSRRDTLLGRGGSDTVFAVDGETDAIDCGEDRDGADIDTVSVDNIDLFTGCEERSVGVLRLVPQTVRAEAGKVARLRLSWRHPDGWRKLRTIELRLLSVDGVPVGEVTIRLRAQRITADGAVRLVRKASRLTRKGKTVTARLAVRLDESVAGQKLGVEVEATDTRGRRQLERDAGTVRVAR